MSIRTATNRKTRSTTTEGRKQGKRRITNREVRCQKVGIIERKERGPTIKVNISSPHSFQEVAALINIAISRSTNARRKAVTSGMFTIATCWGTRTGMIRKSEPIAPIQNFLYSFLCYLFRRQNIPCPTCGKLFWEKAAMKTHKNSQ